jgi:hypothetical protein
MSSHSQNSRRAKATRIVHLTPDGKHWVEAYYELFKQHDLIHCSTCDEPVFYPRSVGHLKETDDTLDGSDDCSDDCPDDSLEEWLFITECTMKDIDRLQPMIVTILSELPHTVLKELVQVSGTSSWY